MCITSAPALRREPSLWLGDVLFYEDGIQGRAGQGRAIIPDLRVDAIAGLVVRGEELRSQACREVILHAHLLPSQKAGHFKRNRASTVDDGLSLC